MKLFVNLITTIRFAYTLFLPFLQTKMSETLFISNIIILFFTDLLDGFLARKNKVQTLYGSLMDTIADKALSIVLLCILIKKIPLMIILLIGEIVIACINTLSMIRGKKPRTRFFGKFKMWFISSTIILGYMHYYDLISSILTIIGTICTFIMQVITTFDYIIKLRKQKSSENPLCQVKNKKDFYYMLFNTKYYMENYRIDNNK